MREPAQPPPARRSLFDDPAGDPVLPPPPRPPLPALHRWADEAPPAPGPPVDDRRDLREREPFGSPGLRLALSGAAAGLGAALLVGLLMAAALPDRSYIGFTGIDDPFAKEAARLAVATTMTRFEVGAIDGTLLPVLLWVVPLAAIALVVAGRARRPDAPAGRALAAWSAATALPFLAGLLVLAAASSGTFDGRSIDVRLGSAVLFGLLTGALGGLGGLALHRRRTRAEAGGRHRVAVAAVTTPLRWLALLLVATGTIGLAGHVVQAAGDEAAATTGRSVATAVVEDTLSVVGIAARGAGLGMFGEAYAAPIPPSDGRLDPYFEAFTGRGLEGQEGRVLDTFRDFDALIDLVLSDPDEDESDARLVALSDAYSPLTFIVLVLGLTGLAIALAVVSGFATARAAGSASVGAAVGFGALSGVVWAVALATLVVVAQTGEMSAGDLFASTLLCAVTAGAFGGVLAHREAGDEPALSA